MQRLTRHIPNGITLLNLFSGCLSIVFAFEGYLQVAGFLIFLAAIFDFLDGFAARLLKAYSNIGKELDSLADVVSFGVAPAIIMYHLLKQSCDFVCLSYQLKSMDIVHTVVPVSAFIIALFSALRLAKFNVDDRQAESFIGLPVPANGIFIASLPIIIQQHPDISSFILNECILIPVFVILSFLLVSEIPMFSLKFKNFGWKKNKIRFAFIGISAILFLSLQAIAIPLVILLYIIISILNNWFVNTKKEIR